MLLIESNQADGLITDQENKDHIFIGIFIRYI